MVSALNSGSSGPGSSSGRGPVMLCSWVTLFTQEYKWVPATKYWGITCDGLASHPGGIAILLVDFMLWKPGKAPAVWASLARVQLYLQLTHNVSGICHVNQKEGGKLVTCQFSSWKQPPAHNDQQDETKFGPLLCELYCRV